MAWRFPWAVVLVGLVLTALLGMFAGQVEVATGNEGFAPEGDEISASERIAEKFGEESSESTMQVLIRDPGDDVITVEGLRAATMTAETIGSRPSGRWARSPYTQLGSPWWRRSWCSLRCWPCGTPITGGGAISYRFGGTRDRPHGVSA